MDGGLLAQRNAHELVAWFKGNGNTVQRSFPAGGATWFLRASEE
ncbi:MAG: hypothetical protein VCA55_02570 [Verrucomicrobiales bacterium]